MAENSATLDAFESALKEFMNSLTHKDDYDFSRFKTIDDVYDETDKIQKKQGREGTLRNMRKMQPFLDCLSQFSEILGTFTEPKPGILNIVWVRRSSFTPEMHYANRS
jgi:hypothetical protein